jgi:hypothetical protein
MTIRFNGLVGIGTPLPQTKLHLYNGPDFVSHRIETGGGVNAWSRTEYANANGMWITGTSRSFNGDQFYIYRVGAPGIAFGIQPNGDGWLLRSFVAFCSKFPSKSAVAVALPRRARATAAAGPLQNRRAFRGNTGKSPCGRGNERT